jgi:DNA-binding XRE family transcriptional regulator
MWITPKNQSPHPAKLSSGFATIYPHYFPGNNCHFIFMTQKFKSMKNEQQEQAKEMYFQANFTKTEIAHKLGVTRKTILFWSKQGNWDQLRMSDRNMPSMVAEKCYYLIDQFASNLLLECNSISNLQLKHAQTIHLLASSIKRLKNRNTANESMEMFGFFLDGLNRREPELAEKIKPEIEDYITVRKNVQTTDFLLEEFNHDGTLPYPVKEMEEKIQDEKDYNEMVTEFETFLESRKPANETPATATNAATKPGNDHSAGDAPSPVENPQDPATGPLSSRSSFPSGNTGAS